MGTSEGSKLPIPLEPPGSGRKGLSKGYGNHLDPHLIGIRRPICRRTPSRPPAHKKPPPDTKNHTTPPHHATPHHTTTPHRILATGAVLFFNVIGRPGSVISQCSTYRNLLSRRCLIVVTAYARFLGFPSRYAGLIPAVMHYADELGPGAWKPGINSSSPTSACSSAVMKNFGPFFDLLVLFGLLVLFVLFVLWVLFVLLVLLALWVLWVSLVFFVFLVLFFY